MEALFELSKEHPTMPVAEARACLKTYGIKYDENYHNGIFIASVKSRVNWKKIADRLAMSFSINEIVGKSIKEMLENIEIEGSFKVEGGNMELRKKIGKIIVEEKGAKVNLEKPEIVIKIFGDYFCREIARINRSQFETRRPMQRPFSIPTTMHPRIARALVNLAEIKENEVLVDPFCGTGGILIEAGLMGIKIIGVEIKEELVKGCRKNLEYYGIKNYRLYNADMRKMDIGLEADAIVTDFPYGRASHLSDRLEKLYKEAFEKMANWIKRGGKAVIGLPSMKFNEEMKKYFEIEQIHPARVHKSLIRFFYVLRKR